VSEVLDRSLGVQKKVINVSNSPLPKHSTTFYYYTLEVFHICPVEIPHNVVLQNSISQLCIKRHHINSLKLAMIGIFTPGKSANTINQGFLFLRANVFFLFVCFVFLLFLWATPAAYGGSQARGRIGAVATGLHQSHSNAGSKPRL